MSAAGGPPAAPGCTPGLPASRGAGAARACAEEPSPPAVGIVIPQFPQLTHIFFWREIVALRREGVRVGIVSTRRSPPEDCPHDFAVPGAKETHYVAPPRFLTALRVLFASPGRTIAAIGYVLGLRESSWGRRIALLAMIPSAADLVDHCRRTDLAHLHVHSCAEAAHLAALARILGGPPYSLTLHGDLHVYGTDHRSKMARASFVTADADAHRREAVRTGAVPEERTTVHWFGVDTDVFREPYRRAAEPGRLHVACVARLHWAKGHEYTLQALRLAADAGCDVRLSIGGDGPHRSEIEAKIRELGLGDRVRMLGPLGEREVLALLQSADAFVLSSVGSGEAAPNAVKEAMAVGLPVVCSVIGGTPDMIRDGENGILVAQRDVDGLAAAFVRLAREPAWRRKIGTAARARALDAFDCRKNARKLLQRIRAAAGA